MLEKFIIKIKNYNFMVYCENDPQPYIDSFLFNSFFSFKSILITNFLNYKKEYIESKITIFNNNDKQTELIFKLDKNKVILKIILIENNTCKVFLPQEINFVLNLLNK
jgi:hypothetical protein